MKINQLRKNDENQRKAIKNSCDRYATAMYINEES